MKILTLQICTRDEWNQQILKAFEGEPQPHTITFKSPALLLATHLSRDILKDFHVSNQLSTPKFQGCPALSG